MMELIRLAHSGFGAVQREVQSLVRSGLVTCTTQGRDRSYQANHAGPLFLELCAIIEKTRGIPHVLRRALMECRAQIYFAVLFGSVPKGDDTAHSDIDVLIVSDDLALEDAFRMLDSAERTLGRTISPRVVTREEFQSLKRGSFWSRVVAGKHVVLVEST